MILTSTEFEDFDRFWSTFSGEGAAKRAEHGSRGATVFRDAGNPNHAYVLFDWDEEGFEAFMADPDVPGIMESAGLRRRPEPTFVEAPRDLDS